jgi:hypothetical protein
MSAVYQAGKGVRLPASSSVSRDDEHGVCPQVKSVRSTDFAGLTACDFVLWPGEGAAMKL